MQQPAAMKHPDPMPKGSLHEDFIEFLKSETKDGFSAPTTVALCFGFAAFFVFALLRFDDVRVKGIASICAASIGALISSLLRNYFRRSR